jgi:hypothetical protein
MKSRKKKFITQKDLKQKKIIIKRIIVKIKIKNKLQVNKNILIGKLD